ncbi:DUF4381 domain-containing protein [Thalassotalea atypica]|uniref:DUF4381 domain-containing protein n=1 Tax=Thalassotalea atypica TaxID=2054316 RepID=UPI0025725FA8|nr:DUF4381 domain-containing protein [Thalassotalea atypica]
MDPLAQLQDIHIPEQIANYPTAPGWIAVYALLSALLVWLIIKFIQRVKLTRNRKVALKQLAQAGSASEYMTILKWAAMAYFPRKDVAHLSGEKLTDFLAAALPRKQQRMFNNKCQNLLITYYQKPFDDNECQQLKEVIEFWIGQALPPKPAQMKEAI